MLNRRLFLVSTAAVAGGAYAEPPKLLAEGEPVIPNGRQYLLRSSDTGRDYLIRVAEPQKKLSSGEKPGVVYVLDGNWYFGMATDIARMLPVGTTTPPVLVVGVGYPANTFDEIVENREQDYTYTPFRDRPNIGGGGEAFAKFLVEDLRAFVGERHAVDHGRTHLAGQSLGGIFTANLLLRRPDSFSGYLIGSPSLWQDGATLTAARNFKSGGKQKVMIGVGSEESPNMRKVTADLAAALSREDSGLRVAARTFDHQHHMSMHGAWLSEGLRFLLDDPV